jgi:hypothetical protein
LNVEESFSYINGREAYTGKTLWGKYELTLPYVFRGVLSFSRILTLFKPIKERKTIHLGGRVKEEACEHFILQLKTNLMTDYVKSLIEDIVRDELKRF